LRSSLLKLFIYPNFFIAIVAVMMSWETQYLSGFTDHTYLWFIFFSTLLSYSFHSIVNTVYTSESPRHKWNAHNRKLLLFIMVLSAAVCSLIFLSSYLDNLLPFVLGGLLTFVYSAPNLEGRLFEFMRKIAFGKTIFLAFMWTYATTMLPILAHDPGSDPFSAFLGSRFYLVYAICILFDLRDREEDRQKGIRALPTMLGDIPVRLFYFVSIAASVFFSIMYTWPFFSITTLILLVPAVIALFIFRITRARDGEILYYVYLDGLMMLSAILHAIYLFSITFVFV
jgi:1,4-dihydroxy-2-naphthoate octaprenyltransferase